MKTLILLLIPISIYSQNGNDFDKKRILEHYGRANCRTANTARFSIYLSRESKRTIFLINLARLDGEKFIDCILEPYLNENYTKTNSYIKTLYPFLRHCKNDPMLKPSVSLSLSSFYHAISNPSSQAGTAHMNLKERIFWGTNFNKTYGECISFGEPTAIGIVMQLLIDEGVPDLGHRKGLLNENYYRVGLSIKKHKLEGYNCTLNFSNLKPIDYLTRPLFIYKKSHKPEKKMQYPKKS